ncbi:NAD(P)-binding domain-containing protein [Ramlibacter sp. PS4R-6]|uniref:NAD(P)-binding domain-containing protein n=1 Tax=Ramlibacter sp. PS4R-6 TaxID=3133438 RepID=UPI0030AAC144
MASVAIIGAGPYGLSLAAHLRAAGVDCRIFGRPMATWRDRMPAGMLLKSDGCASNLYEPGGFTLRRYCARHGIAYDDRQLPVPLQAFVDYALAFQKEFVPDLDTREIVRLERAAGGGFVLHPSRGQPVTADKVVVAVGVSHFQHVPPLFAALPREALTHSSEHTGFAPFAGRDVLVVGGGASALDTAAALHRAGSRVVLMSRRKFIDYITPPQPELTLLDRIARPPTDLGPGWRHLFCTEMPLAFHFLPARLRREIVRRHLGPQPGWSIRAETEGHFPFVLGATPVGARMNDGRVSVTAAMADGSSRTLACDHVIAATGYKVDLRRIPFLGPELLAGIRANDHVPRLSLHFESSLGGLYFTGLAAAESFGPVLRFACGAKFAAPHLSRHLARELRVRDAAEPAPTTGGPRS